MHLRSSQEVGRRHHGLAGTLQRQDPERVSTAGDGQRIVQCGARRCRMRAFHDTGLPDLEDDTVLCGESPGPGRQPSDLPVENFGRVAPVDTARFTGQTFGIGHALLGLRHRSKGAP